MNISKCHKCGMSLVDGPDVERSVEGKTFTCRIDKIPIKICPRGCSGFYWYWLDFGVEVMNCLSPDCPNIAKRSFGIFKIKQCCKKCGSELLDKSIKHNFTFDKVLRKGTNLVMTIDAPSLVCPKCAAYFLPAQRSTGDHYYVELADTITKVITKDLIYQ